MPQTIQLWNQHIKVEKGTEIDQRATAENGGSPVVIEIWRLVFTDRMTRDEISISISRDMRDTIVRDLTGGVVLAGGDLPNV